MKNNKSNLGIYSCIWGIAIVILIFSIFQNIGDAKVVNYSGIIRGASQKVVKEELQGVQNDEEIAWLDDIMEDLQTGDGKFGLAKFNNKEYQAQLKDVANYWSEIKTEITNVRNGADNTKLFTMSEEYFDKTNAMVSMAEAYANKKLIVLIIAFVIYLCFSVSFFSWWNRSKKKEIDSIKYRDELTGISNFLSFKIDLEKLISKMDDSSYILIHFDIDDFKVINTNYGYSFGTKLLVIIAETLDEFIHDDELCTRQSSDNFLICTRYNEATISNLKNMLYENIQNRTELNIANDITFCMGARVFKKGEVSNPEELLDSATLSHKNAKLSGRNGFVMYNDEFMDKLIHESMIIKRMHYALEDEEFQLYLQPKFDIATGTITSAEALCRWIIPDYGMLPPNDFIPLFESNGIISDLDFYMLKRTCQFIKDHHLEQSGFTISVNFSRVTIYHKDFYDRLITIMDSYNVPLSCIEIEITESAFNGLDDTIIKMLERLQKAGFRISIDDFGTGYSTLNLLNTLPIDVLKIDRGFVNDVATSKNIIGLIIGVAHTLNIKVVCEGIETKSQLEALQKMHCDCGQGFYVSKPIPREEFFDQYLKVHH